MINIVEKLIPKKGALWRIFPGFLKNLLDALNEEPKRIRDFFLSIVAESNPGTAIETQEEWYQQYGLVYNETKSLSEKQAETLERYIALGDQDIVYVQDQVTKAGFVDVTIVENSPPEDDNTNVCGEAICGDAECWAGAGYGSAWIFHFFVMGSVDNKQEGDRLEALLQKIAPGHLIPVLSVIESNNVCGDAVCGDAVCDG